MVFFSVSNILFCLFFQKPFKQFPHNSWICLSAGSFNRLPD